MIRIIDLFSGIGGFSLAARMAWGNNVETVFFCEKNKFCQSVLRKNFGQDIKIVEDIHNAPKFKTEKPIDIICGGFPCQPFSMAGKRRGKTDDRYLWPEMLETIETFRPDWVLAENVAGIVNMELDQVLSDLEDQAYTCQTLIIPACAVNAPHRRDRVWIIAHAKNANGWRTSNKEDKRRRIKEIRGSIIDVANSGHRLGCSEQRKQQKKRTKVYVRSNGNSYDIKEHRLQRTHTTRGIYHDGRDTKQFRYQEWDETWYEVALRTCVRGMDDGLPAGVDGFELSKSRHRIERLKALGNAIVPQVAAEIFKAMNCRHERIDK